MTARDKNLMEFSEGALVSYNGEEATVEAIEPDEGSDNPIRIVYSDNAWDDVMASEVELVLS